VREREVPRPPGRHRERQTYQLRPHRVERGGLGVERQQLCATAFGHHIRQLPRVLDDYGLRARGNERRGCRGPRDGGCPLGCRSGARRDRDLQRRQLGDQRSELELGEQLGEPRDVRRADPQPVEVERHRHVAPDGHELPRQPRQIGVLPHRLSRPFQDRIEVAERFEQLERGLLPHTLHPRHVVRAVAHERQVVHHPLGRHSQALARVGLVHPVLFDGCRAAATRVQERDARPDQLVEVLVARYDHDLQSTRRRGERADHIVGFVALHADQRHVERFEDLLDPLDRPVELLLQLLGELLARRLVLGVGLVPE